MLTPADIRIAFLSATHSMSGARARWGADSCNGCTDEQLAARLRYELGTLGGCYPAHGTENLAVDYAGDGLRIWAHEGGVRRTAMRPILEGIVDVRYGRLTLNIPNPENLQLTLF